MIQTMRAECSTPCTRAVQAGEPAAAVKGALQHLSKLSLNDPATCFTNVRMQSLWNRTSAVTVHSERFLSPFVATSMLHRGRADVTPKSYIAMCDCFEHFSLLWQYWPLPNLLGSCTTRHMASEVVQWCAVHGMSQYPLRSLPSICCIVGDDIAEERTSDFWLFLI